MKNATDNAKQIIKDLTLEYNKLRQASITKELLEITSAAMADIAGPSPIAWTCDRMMSSICAAAPGRSADRVIRPATSVKTWASSWLRPTPWPFSRASWRRRSVGSSVRSPLMAPRSGGG